MGKKTKTGKSRKDKYYHLAKESGLRARSAFKLMQLNRKFQFLEKSRVCIDLCAAPGGWLQVAQQNMPMSSLILGVDLVAIKPIHNVVTFQEDITTEKCKQTLKKELHTWKADVVLHDGAPNVGKNWLHDAFQQAQLTLQALKLATEFLKKGGWFVSKVFRSKDYHALIWVLKQLFKSVHATKPQASRNESAEIFVVCQNYKAPDKLDPKFLDVKYVFKEVNMEPKSMLNLLHPEKVKKAAEGYDENDTAFYHKLKASKFIESENHVELLSAAHEIVFDTEEIRDHVFTTKEIKECCKDIKVLGKKEIRLVMNWRKKLTKEQEDKAKEKEDGEKMDAESVEDGSDAEEADLDKQIADMVSQQEQDCKRKRKQVMKEKRKLRDKMELQMIHPGDQIEERDDIDLFDIKRIKSKHGMSEVQKEDLMDEEDESDEDDDDDLPGKRKRLMETYNRYKDQEGQGLESESDEDKESSEEESEEEVTEEDKNPLVVDLESKDVRTKKKTEMWFSKDIFNGLEQECDENLEIEKMTADYRKRGGIVLEDNAKNRVKKSQVSDDSGHDSEEDMELDMLANNHDDDDSGDDDDSDSDSSGDSQSDYDVHGSLQRSLVQQRRGKTKQEKTAAKNKSSKDGFEVVPAEEPATEKVIKLDPVELALGEQLIKSSKTRREMEELSYNRYTHGDESLPDWFSKDESRHNRKQLPVTKEQIDYYKQRLQAINARPIKKIAEAKARKKRKMTKKLERARKKAESVSDSVEITDIEKWKQIKDIYKRAGLLNKKKKEITYVVAKRGGGKKPSRPAGVKGFYKVVDKRMKQDKRYKKQQDKNKGKSKGKARVRR